MRHYFTRSVACRPIGRHTFSSSVALSLVLVTLSLGACAGAGDSRSGAAPGRIAQCKAGDQQISDESQCLQDDAACYALANGDWCTGERGNTCPAGSSPVAAGASCPPGARCFDYSESLTCAISVN